MKRWHFWKVCNRWCGSYRSEIMLAWQPPSDRETWFQKMLTQRRRIILPQQEFQKSPCSNVTFCFWRLLFLREKVTFRRKRWHLEVDVTFCLQMEIQPSNAVVFVRMSAINPNRVQFSLAGHSASRVQFNLTDHFATGGVPEITLLKCHVLLLTSPFPSGKGDI